MMVALSGLLPAAHAMAPPRPTPPSADPISIQKITIEFVVDVTATQFGQASFLGRSGLHSAIHYNNDPISFRVLSNDLNPPLTGSQSDLLMIISPVDSVGIAGLQLIGPNGAAIAVNTSCSAQYGCELDLWLEQAASPQSYQSLLGPMSSLAMPNGTYTVWARMSDGTYKTHSFQVVTTGLSLF